MGGQAMAVDDRGSTLIGARQRATQRRVAVDEEGEVGLSPARVAKLQRNGCGCCYEDSDSHRGRARPSKKGKWLQHSMCSLHEFIAFNETNRMQVDVRHGRVCFETLQQLSNSALMFRYHLN